MSRCAATFILALFLAPAAHAAWYPVFQPSYIQVRPGETITVNVSGGWLSGIMLVPFVPMTFVSEDPSIASAEGFLPTNETAALSVTGLRPGVTRVRTLSGASGTQLWGTSALIVVAERELPVAIAAEGILAPGNRITLRAISDEPDATFAWFHGRLNGLYVWPAGEGSEFSFVAGGPWIYEHWVVMTSQRGAGATGVTLTITKPPSRRRAVGH